MVYNITLTENENNVLKKIALSVNKTPQEIIDEQVAFYIKQTLLNSYPEFTNDVLGLTDKKGVELTALLATTKEDFLTK